MTRSRLLGRPLAAPLLLASAVFIATATSGSTAHAAPPPHEQGLGGALTGEAHEQWVDGKRIYQEASDDKGYQLALTKFRRAYELVPDARLLFNIAACEKQLKHYGDTVRDLRRYMQLTPSLTVKERDQAIDLLKTLEPYVSELTVNSNVEGALVTLDDEPLGTTPISGTVLIEAGARHLHATKSGMGAFDQKLDVPGGGPSAVTITLVPEIHQGRLDVEVHNDQAVIFLDDAPVGSEGRFNGPVTSGTHRLHLEAKGKQPDDETIAISDGQPISISKTLQDPPSHGVPAWVWIAGGVVVAGGLATAGYFIFKPGDIKDAGPTGNLPPGSVTPMGRMGVVHF